jgi:two-component system sensor kinase FixL
MTEPASLPILEAWRALLAATIDAVMVIDHQGHIELFNSAAERLFGYTAAEVLGRNVSMLMTDPDRSAHDRYLRRYMQTRERHVIGIGREVTAQRRDGTNFPVHLAIGEIAGPGPQRFVGQLHDITERRAALVALQNERDRARQYLAIAQVALLVLDGDNRVQLINRRGCEILQRPENEVVGLDWLTLAIADDDRAAVREQLSAIRASGQSGGNATYHEYEVLTKDGERRLIAWQGASLEADSGRRETILLSGDDVTARRDADEAARRAADRMNEVARLASLGEMAGGIAHEINQPLTAISNYAQASLRLLALPEPALVDVRDALEQVSRQALRAGDIIRRLRNLLRKQEAFQEPVHIEDLVADVIGFCSGDARLSETRIRCHAQSGLPAIMVDKVQIQQVIFNLLRNAMEAVLANSAGNRRVDIRCHRDADYIQVLVQDNGAGVPADFVNRMFTPLQTTKSTGTGLGLAISKTIVNAHQGDLCYRADLGPGACFEIRLPIPNGACS